MNDETKESYSPLVSELLSPCRMFGLKPMSGRFIGHEKTTRGTQPNNSCSWLCTLSFRFVLYSCSLQSYPHTHTVFLLSFLLTTSIIYNYFIHSTQFKTTQTFSFLGDLVVLLLVVLLLVRGIGLVLPVAVVRIRDLKHKRRDEDQIGAAAKVCTCALWPLKRNHATVAKPN